VTPPVGPVPRWVRYANQPAQESHPATFRAAKLPWATCLLVLDKGDFQLRFYPSSTSALHWLAGNIALNGLRNVRTNYVRYAVHARRQIRRVLAECPSPLLAAVVVAVGCAAVVRDRVRYGNAGVS
jgi:hypothetical protein